MKAANFGSDAASSSAIRPTRPRGPTRGYRGDPARARCLGPGSGAGMSGHNWRAWLIALAIFAAPGAAHAIVDMKNANYVDSWLDGVSAKTGISISRTYN